MYTFSFLATQAVFAADSEAEAEVEAVVVVAIVLVLPVLLLGLPFFLLKILLQMLKFSASPARYSDCWTIYVFLLNFPASQTTDTKGTKSPPRKSHLTRIFRNTQGCLGLGPEYTPNNLG